MFWFARTGKRVPEELPAQRSSRLPVKMMFPNSIPSTTGLDVQNIVQYQDCEQNQYRSPPNTPMGVSSSSSSNTATNTPDSNNTQESNSTWHMVSPFSESAYHGISSPVISLDSNSENAGASSPEISGSTALQINNVEATDLVRTVIPSACIFSRDETGELSGEGAWEHIFLEPLDVIDGSSRGQDAALTIISLPMQPDPATNVQQVQNQLWPTEIPRQQPTFLSPSLEMQSGDMAGALVCATAGIEINTPPPTAPAGFASSDLNCVSILSQGHLFTAGTIENTTPFANNLVNDGYANSFSSIFPIQDLQRQSQPITDFPVRPCNHAVGNIWSNHESDFEEEECRKAKRTKLSISEDNYELQSPTSSIRQSFASQLDGQHEKRYSGTHSPTSNHSSWSSYVTEMPIRMHNRSESNRSQSPTNILAVATAGNRNSNSFYVSEPPSGRLRSLADGFNNNGFVFDAAWQSDASMGLYHELSPLDPRELNQELGGLQYNNSLEIEYPGTGSFAPFTPQDAFPNPFPFLPQNSTLATAATALPNISGLQAESYPEVQPGNLQAPTTNAQIFEDVLEGPQDVNGFHMGIQSSIAVEGLPDYFDTFSEGMPALTLGASVSGESLSSCSSSNTISLFGPSFPSQILRDAPEQSPILPTVSNAFIVGNDEDDEGNLRKTNQQAARKNSHALILRRKGRGTINSSRMLKENANNRTDRPKEKMKKSSYMPERREEVNQMRTIGACLRCQYTKSPCGPGKICWGCISVQGKTKVWHIPCLRVKITEAQLFRKGNSKFAQEDSVILNRDFVRGNKNRRKSIILGRGNPGKVNRWRSHGFTNPPTLKISVKEFIPIPGDLVFETWIDPVNGVQTLVLPKFTAINPKETQIAVKNYITDAYDLFKIDMVYQKDRLVNLVFKEAIRFDQVQRAKLPPNEKNETTMVRNAMYIWIGSRISAEGLSMYPNHSASSATPIMGISMVMDQNSPYYLTVPIPPLLDHLIDTVTINYMVDLKDIILKSIQDRLKKRKPDTWYEIFLTIFVLLSNLEFVYRAQFQYMKRHENTTTGKSSNIQFFTETWMAKWEETAKLLIVHFRIALKGALPFQLDWDSYVKGGEEGGSKPKRKKDDIPNVIQSAGLDEDAVKFMGEVKGILRARMKEFEELRKREREGDYDTDLIWCSQLFLDEEVGAGLGGRSA